MNVHFRGFPIRESPFHKEYDDNMSPLNVRLSKKAIKDLENHFKELYDNEKGAYSKGIQNICYEYLDKLCFEKKVFLNQEVIMLLPKTDDVNELEAKSQIIAYVNHDNDYNEYYVSKHRADNKYLTYDLMNFNETYFSMNFLKETKKYSVLFNQNPNLNSFEEFKQSQAELYPNLDLDNCYFVRFPLNNHLDRRIEGQYHHHTFKGNHIGLYIFEDILEGRKIFAIIDWYYQSEFNKQIQIDYQFADGEALLNWIKHDYEDDEVLKNSFIKAFSDEYRQSRLKILEDDLLEKLEIVRSLQIESDED